jgi:hypothetical protein
MSQIGALEALKAAFRGTVGASEALGPLRAQIEALTEDKGPDATLLEDVARVAAGVALAAAALRSLSESLSQQHGAEQ